MTGVLVESIEKLDFDYTPLCEVDHYWALCRNLAPAEWYVVVRCCGMQVLMCDKDLRNKLTANRVHCRFCDIWYHPAEEAYIYRKRIK